MRLWRLVFHQHRWVERRTGDILEWHCERCGDVRLGIVGGHKPPGIIIDYVRVK